MKKDPVLRLFVIQLILALVVGGAGALLFTWDSLEWLRDKEGSVLVPAMIIAWHLPLMEKMLGSMTPESYPYSWGMNSICSFLLCGFLIGGAIYSLENPWFIILIAFTSFAISMLAAEVMACDALNNGAEGTRKQMMVKVFPYGIGILAGILRP